LGPRPEGRPNIRNSNTFGFSQTNDASRKKWSKDWHLSSTWFLHSRINGHILGLFHAFSRYSRIETIMATKRPIWTKSFFCRLIRWLLTILKDFYYFGPVTKGQVMKEISGTSVTSRWWSFLSSVHWPVPERKPGKCTSERKSPGWKRPPRRKVIMKNRKRIYFSMNLFSTRQTQVVWARERYMNFHN
jgi:hypothetical protein